MEKEKKGFKLNAFDFLIILFVFAIILGGLLYYNKSKGDNNNFSKKIVIKAEIQSKDDVIVNSIKKGDKVYIGTKEKDFGTITDVLVKDATLITKDLNKGAYKLSLIPKKYDIILTIESLGSETITDIFLMNSKIAVGEQIFLRNKDFTAPAFVLSLDVFDNTKHK